jgi:hypothetical protein
MKAYLAVICVSFGLAACGGNEEKNAAKQVQEAPADKALIEEAKGAVKALGGGLKHELITAMKAGGPTAALDVCVTKAPELTAAVATEKQLDIGRISLKNRNTKNAPNEWQTTILNDFEARKLKGEKPDTLVYAKTITVDGKQEFRFMKAIPTGGVCLTCHGATLAPEITAKLKEHYPDDKATGFKPGDLRGAFYVTKVLN